MREAFSDLILCHGLNFVLFVKMIKFILILKKLISNRLIRVQFALFDINDVFLAMFQELLNFVFLFEMDFTIGLENLLLSWELLFQ